jgi:hypothetical protein
MVGYNLARTFRGGDGVFMIPLSAVSLASLRRIGIMAVAVK